MAARDYPVARPVWMEEDSDFLGGPFQVMECVAGDTLLNLLLKDHFALWWALPQMADVHARLHQMPLEELTVPARPFLDRQMEDLQAAVDDYGLRGLAPGVAWLRRRRSPPAPPCMVHMDYHPGNILMRDGRRAAVLDWSEADIGDRHADLGKALFTIDAGPVEDPSPWERLVLPVGRWLTHHGYLHAYRRRLPVDPERLRYYQALAALQRLTWYGRWLAAGPRVMGFKPGAEDRVRPGHVAEVERYFERHSGVSIRLDVPLRAAASRPMLTAH